MNKRFISAVLAFVMVFAIAVSTASCADKKVDYSGEKTDITFVLDKTEFVANTLNKPYTNQDIALFSRGYSIDGKETAYIGGDHSDHTVISVRYNLSYDEFTIIERIDGEGDKADTLIPVNGFVISLKPELIDGLRVKESQTVDVFGFDVSDSEKLDLAAYTPSEAHLARRIYMVDPIDIPSENIIYLVTEDYEKDITLGENSIAVILEKKSEKNSSVKSFMENGTVAAGTYALIFNGCYNSEYALSSLKVGNNIMISKLNEANSICYDSAIKQGDNVYKIGKANTNVTKIENGVYLFDSNNSAGVIPASEKDFLAIAVNDGTVTYIGEKNERLIIPTNKGYVLVFGGDKLSVGESYALGDKLDELLIFPVNTPEQFVKINGHCYSFENVDVAYTNEPVLYTYNYGETTGTTGTVAEIAIKDGKVVSVSVSEGNTAIPENGYVISMPARGDALANAKRVSAGDDARVALTKCEYNLSVLEITNFNAVRYTDNLIVYDKSNTKTGTNQYGFEIGVDKDGVMISGSNAGNMTVPDGGFVISGHGSMETAISDLYIYGGTVKCDKSARQLAFYSTPVSASTDVAAKLEDVKNKFSICENALYDIDYGFISDKLDTCKSLIDSVETVINNGDPVVALNSLYEITVLLSGLEEAMITDKAVEERSVWYRSTVKSDDDVRAVIEKCVQYNINAIYVETWYNGKTIGKTENPLIQHYDAQHGDYDALEGFVRIGHENGIQIHAWVENFFVGTTSQKESDASHISNYNESWLLLDKNGKNYYVSAEYGNFIFLNPQNRECRDLVLSVYRELLENYDIDGLHLDYIRYPEHNGDADFGYNQDTIADFKAKYGHTGDPRSYKSGSKQYSDWIKYRREVITSFVKEVNDLVKAVKPEAWITAACYPSLVDSPNNIYQHTAEWVKQGYIDQVFSMTYSNGTEYVYNNAKEFLTVCKDKALYSTGLTLFSGNSGAELLSQINATRDAGATGQALFSLSSLLGYEEYENVIINYAYRTKAVSLFDIDGAVIAYADDLIAKCDGVYTERTTGQDAVIASVKKLLEEIKNEASKQEYSSVEEYKALLTYTLERTDAILAIAENADGPIKNALEREVGEMDYNLSILYKRMEAKTAK